jgi:universal stress protein E
MEQRPQRFPRSILVGSDLSQSADRTIRQASDIAAKGGARLHVVSAYRQPRGGFGREADELPESVLAEVRTALPAQIRRILPGDRLPASQEVRFGSPARVLLDRAVEVEAEVIVLGAHRGTDVHAQFLGTTSDEVIRTSPVPCLSLRSAVDLPIRRVGVAIDLSHVDSRALAHALAWASGLGDPETGGARLCVVHVLDGTGGAIGGDEPGLMDREIDSARDAVEGGRNVTADRVILEDRDAPGALLQWIERNDVDLVVVGTRGGGGSGARIGSVSSAIALRSRCPVLLVPDSGTGEG